MSTAQSLDQVELIDAVHYAEHGYPHEAFRLLGITKSETFQEFGATLGIAVP